MQAREAEKVMSKRLHRSDMRRKALSNKAGQRAVSGEVADGPIGSMVGETG